MNQKDFLSFLQRIDYITKKGRIGGDKRKLTYVEGSGELARFFAQPVLLGKNGVEEILNYGSLSDFEQTKLDDALETLRSDIKIGEEFIN